MSNEIIKNKKYALQLLKEKINGERTITYMLSMKETYKMPYSLHLLLYAVSVIVQHDENLYFCKGG